jgi:hypothetical protein
VSLNPVGKFAAGVVDTDGKFVAGIVDTLTPVSLIPAANCHCYQQH